MKSPSKRCFEDYASWKKRGEYRRSCKQQMVRVVEKLRIRRMGVQVRWAPSSIFPKMVAKRATLSWAQAEALALAVWQAQTCSVSPRRL